uniref:Uncharacterized protein n=1 Tax=Ananas comosus var. bracteatus TaxID=296719 RepID=A0A6V7QE37_ANACO|nr:unnamed protein product [Ananas comosus var. bracteatus]
MSRPLSVRPTPSNTDAATPRACSRATYTCGGTHSSSSAWTRSVSGSCAGGWFACARSIRGQSGTLTGADAATCRLLVGWRTGAPSSKASESPPTWRSSRGPSAARSAPVRRAGPTAPLARPWTTPPPRRGQANPRR